MISCPLFNISPVCLKTGSFSTFIFYVSCIDFFGVDRWLKTDMSSLLNGSWSPYSQLQIIVESLTMPGE